MHMYVIARADHKELERWVWGLNTKYFPWKTPSGEMLNMPISVRPIQLFEIVFPKENLPEVCGLVHPYTYTANLDKYAKLMQKLCGLKPIPYVQRIPWQQPPWCIDVVGIGLKEDKRRPDGTEIL